jgi:hypothetical protein
MFENIIFFPFGYCYFISLLRAQGPRGSPYFCTFTFVKKDPYFTTVHPPWPRNDSTSTFFFHWTLILVKYLPKYFCVDLDIKHPQNPPSHLYDYGTCCSAREFNCCHALIQTNGNFKNSLLSGLFEHLTMTHQYSFTLYLLDHKFYIF